MCVTKGEHTGHTVDDIDDAQIAMKKRLTTSIGRKITNLEKTTAARVDKLKEELAKQEHDINTRFNIVMYMIAKALNEWKKTQLQKAQQAMNKVLETNKAQQEALTEKLQLSELQSMMTACKEVESKETDASLPKINLDELQNKLTSLCEMIQTLIKDNHALLSSALSPIPSSHKDTDESHISWDFIGHLCSSAVPRKDPTKRPYIPQGVSRVANMYNLSRNRQFLHVVHNRQGGQNVLVCKTDDFIYKYDCCDKKAHTVFGLWDSRVSEDIEFLNKNKYMPLDPEISPKLEKAIKRWQEVVLHNLRNGKPELRWHN